MFAISVAGCIISNFACFFNENLTNSATKTQRHEGDRERGAGNRKPEKQDNRKKTLII